MNKISRLSTTSIKKSFQKRPVLSGISMQVSQGEIVGLLGRNGAGKTTTFRIVTGFLTPDSGRVEVDGKDITDMPVFQRVRSGMSYLPQESSVFQSMTVFENLFAIQQMIDSSGAEEKVIAVLKEMGLSSLQSQKAYQLSGGEKRRLEIARALLLSPRFLLLDEPFAGIDPIQISEIHTVIRQLRDRGMGIIVTDHNVREILKITDRSYIVNRGRVIFEGDSDCLIRDRRVRREYLGHHFRWN